MPIEDVLAWAFREELPKVRRLIQAGPCGPQAYGRADRGMTELLMTIDPNRYGCVPDLGSSFEAHQDALIVGDAVLGLSDVVLEAPGDDVLGDIVMLTPIERAECNARGFVIAQERWHGLVTLVTRRAILGGMPAWESHGPVKRRVKDNGRGGAGWYRSLMRSAGEGRPSIEIEVDGYDRNRNRPYPGAYRKMELVPDPALLAAERIEYQAWVLALDSLVDDLAGRLGRCEAVPTRFYCWPWDAAVVAEDGRRVPRVIFMRTAA